jgi:hypothetical protein
MVYYSVAMVRPPPPRPHRPHRPHHYHHRHHRDQDFAEKAEGEEDKKDSEKSEDDKEESEKSEDSKDEEAEKGEGEETDEKLPKNLKTAMKSIGDAINVIDSLTKKMSGIKKLAKSQTVVKKGIADIDAFAIAVAEYVDTVESRLAKSQKSIPGFAQSIVQQIHNNPELQMEIRKMMKDPGVKKSVAFGNPYMVTKDGKRFSLTATPVQETVEKSEKSKVDFKTLYKSNFSAIREAGEQE